MNMDVKSCLERIQIYTKEYDYEYVGIIVV